MAKGLYRLRCQEAGSVPEVASAGFLGSGVPVPEEVLEVMADRHVDLKRHRSRAISVELVRRADLVVTMTRQQLLDVAIMAPDDWTRCFTLVDVVRRAEAIGPPMAGTDPERWVRQLHSGRTRSAIMALDLSDDIDDPMGGRRADYQKTASQIDDLVSRLVNLVDASTVSSST